MTNTEFELGGINHLALVSSDMKQTIDFYSGVLGMPLIWGFKKTSDPNSFEDGHIYNGENGKTYTANISLQPDGKLRLRGYVGTPLFGETQVWTRVQ